MFRNYLKISYRNLLKNKLYSLINILGLAVGLTCCLLIFMFVADELSYDRYHSKADRIYRVTRDFMSESGTVDLHLGEVAPPIGPLIKNDFPEIEAVARILKYNSFTLLSGEKAFNEDNAYVAEEDIFKIFDIDVIKGNPAKALSAPLNVMLSEKMARKYFAEEDAMGKTLIINYQGQKVSLKISGVFKNFPSHSHFHPEFLLSFVTLKDNTFYGDRQLKTNWGNNAFATYVLLPNNYAAEKISKRFPAFLDKHLGPYARANWGTPKSWKASEVTHLYLQKLTDIHLYSHLDSELEANGDINTVFIFSAIGLFILLIACINFINLSTARSASRAKEVGMRKVVGAYRKDLIFQFLAESVCITLISMMLALCFVELARPSLNSFIEKNLYLDYYNRWYLIFLLGAFSVLVGTLSGFYPAFFLSAFDPVKVLKGKIASGAKNSWLRTSLVVTQFSIAIVLMIGTLVVYQQLTFIKNKNLGYNKDHIVTLNYYNQLDPQYEAFRNELLNNPAVKNVGRSLNAPGNRLLNSSGAKIASQNDSLVETNRVIKFENADYDFFETYGMKIVAGRNFSKKYATDDSLGYILNEAAVRMIGWENPAEAVGQVLHYGNVKGKIIGVLKDFHFESLHQEILPLVYYMSNSANFGGYNTLSVKINKANVSQGLQHLEVTWKKFLSNRPFDFQFQDVRLRDLYEKEKTEGVILMIFSGLAILIACLGLFGLISFITEQRTKEIGIRKVLGASILSILRLFSKDFVRLVLISAFISFPLAYWAMHNWLQGFAYKIQINVLVFVIAGGLALLIALATITFQILKVARVNPVEVLKNE